MVEVALQYSVGKCMHIANTRALHQLTMLSIRKKRVSAYNCTVVPRSHRKSASNAHEQGR